jgi:hypothetical protein
MANLYTVLWRWSELRCATSVFHSSFPVVYRGSESNHWVKADPGIPAGTGLQRIIQFKKESANLFLAGASRQISR